MAQLQNQLLPSLFDRLTDHEPRNRKETSQNKIFNLEQYRKAVLRDVLFLLNTTNLQSSTYTEVLPNHVQNSTLNYGIPPFSGVNFSDLACQTIEENVKQAITNFEPRLDSRSLQVLVYTGTSEIDNDLQNKLTIEIKGHLKLNPYPQEFLLRTSMDIETGIFDLQGGSKLS